MTTRSYLWLAAAATLLLLLGVILVAAEGRRDAIDLRGRIEVVQRRQTQLADLMNDLATAETAERGYLLTREPTYLQSYGHSSALIGPILESLLQGYQRQGSASGPAQRADVERLRAAVGERLADMSASLALYAERGPASGMGLVRTDIGRDTTNRIRAIVLAIGDREGATARAILGNIDRNATRSFLSMVVVTCINMLLVAGAVVLLDRDLRRRTLVAGTLRRHAEELEQEVDARTAELSTLSSHLQHVAETEKAALARELHDELGGLLVVAKMDIAWLEKQLAGHDEPAVQLRWRRIRDALDQGVDLKRRIVENLRPTLLDTMGLVPALQWVLQETCGRAHLACTQRYPEGELRLTDDASIKIFRLVQEALMNAVKHARASAVTLELIVQGDELVVRIADNGVGVPTARQHQGGFHGLAAMRHRVTSLGGRWELRSPPAGGTEILARLPLARILAA